jgi:hypothetical protein
MQLRADDRDEFSLEATDSGCHEKQNCCPYCHSVLSIEVTLAEDDSPTLSRLRAVEL